MAHSFSFRASARGSRSCAIAVLVAIVGLVACTTQQQQVAQRPGFTPPPPQAPAPHQLSEDRPDYFRLPNMPTGQVPVRVGVILPLSSGSPATRALANAMMKAAQLALFDANNHNIVLITADDTGSGADAASSAQRLIGQGAEVIVGPLFSQSVSAVAPLARDRGVPVLAFSTDSSVAGNGVYLLSFLPQTEVKRVVSYAAQQGYKSFGGMIPQTAYGDVVVQAFRDSVTQTGGTVTDIERFSPTAGAVVEPAAALAKTNPSAVLIAQGGTLLRGIVPALVYDGLDRTKVKFLGTGLWDDAAVAREPLAQGGWFAAPEPEADDAFSARFKKVFGSTPPQLASLAYDAISLVALLSSGEPYHRFSRDALTDPNGFAGVDGIFRLNIDGSVERGLAVLSVSAGGFHVVDPAPRTFQKTAS
jgi:branched-chain amino acid transport system substrate-binding protein